MTMVVDELRGMKWNRDEFVGGLLLAAPMKVGGMREGRRWTCGGDWVYWAFFIYYG